MAKGDDDLDVVVIGSGFGGSVVARRLARAGKRVLVLERGRPHPPGSFLRTTHGMRGNFWEPDQSLFGMFDVWAFDHLDVVLSSGLGGGSLIYANVLLRKPEETFVKEDLSNGGEENWPLSASDLECHYTEIERLLDVQHYPVERDPYAKTPKTMAMQEAAEKLGLESGLVQPPLAIAFGGAADSPGSPVGGPGNIFGVQRTTCRLCGECDVGCNYGSKSTLDLTLLSEASRAGAELRTCCEAVRIHPVGRSYVVYYRQHMAARGDHPEELLDPIRDPNRAVTAKRVVIAAGALGTPRLLLKSRLSLRNLSPALGRRFSANGDYFAWIRNCRDPETGGWRNLEPSRGPVITTSIRIDEERSTSEREHYLQDAGAPAIADWLWQLAELPGNAWRARSMLARRAWDRLRGQPEAHESGMLAALFGDAHASNAMMPVLAMGRDYSNGRLRLDGDSLQLDWSREPSQAYYDSVQRSLAQLADAMGGELLKDGLDLLRKAITVHPVGGCAMASEPRHGVVDSWGEVFGHPGLWVADGSVMPGPVGPNPSLTIAALADRSADRILERIRKD